MVRGRCIILAVLAAARLVELNQKGGEGARDAGVGAIPVKKHGRSSTNLLSEKTFAKASISHSHHVTIIARPSHGHQTRHICGDGDLLPSLVGLEGQRAHELRGDALLPTPQKWKAIIFPHSSCNSTTLSRENWLLTS